MKKYKTFLLDYHTEKLDAQQPLRRHRTSAEWHELDLWLGTPMFGAAVFVFAALFRATWGRSIFQGPPWVSLWPLPLWLLSIFLHEGLHGLGFLVFGEVGWKSLRFGIEKWPYLNAYATCSEPIPFRAHRQATALPGFVLGVGPGLIGVIFGSVGLTLWGAFNCAFACGDVTRLLLEQRQPDDGLVRMRVPRGSWGLCRPDNKAQEARK